MRLHKFDLFLGGHYRCLDNNGKIYRNPNAPASVNNSMPLEKVGRREPVEVPSYYLKAPPLLEFMTFGT